MPTQPDGRGTAARLWNGLRLISGVSRPVTGASPRELVWQRDEVRLFRYAVDAAAGPAVLLVMSLVTRPYVFDLRPGSSLVERLVERGFDVFLLDWGAPGPVEAANTFETYCDDYLPRASAVAASLAGAHDVTMLGYCLGGVLSLLFTAAHPEARVRNLVLLATPIDFSSFGPLASVVGSGRVQPDDLLDETGNLPAEAVLAGIRLLQPTAEVTSYADLWHRLDDRRFIEAFEALTGWSQDHIPFPGAAFRQLVDLFVKEERLLEGVVPLGGRPVRLADVTCPVLSVTGERDRLVPSRSSDPIAGLLAGTTVDELRVPAGHVGLIVGREAQVRTIPAMLDWIAARSDEAPVSVPRTGAGAAR